ncbi:MAG TPA: methylmalonyl Co-A mutase-associated GTPase MeaB [Nitrososphaeraceae archaeon]
MHLAEGISNSDPRSLARAISIVDNNEPEAHDLIKAIFNMTGGARTVGFTGPAGAGKSSLIGKLISYFQELGQKIAVLAVDPSSPLTGGAILGDRVRMQGISDDENVFMRSLASRGASGGVSKSLRNVIRVLDAAGYKLVLVESVGAGQVEVDIASVVNLTVVVLSPQTGDKIQAIKAGLNEIGDLYVVNKSDLDGSATLFNSILDLVGDVERKPIVTSTSVRSGMGIKELALTITNLLNSKNINYKAREKVMLESELKEMVIDILTQKFCTMLVGKKEMYTQLIDDLIHRRIDPFRAAESLADSLVGVLRS